MYVTNHDAFKVPPASSPSPRPADGKATLDIALTTAALNLLNERLAEYRTAARSAAHAYLTALRSMVRADQLGDALRAAGVELGGVIFPDVGEHLNAVARSLVSRGLVELADPVLQGIDLG